MLRSLQAAQQNIRTFQNSHIDSTVFHRSAVVEITGDAINLDAFEQAIHALVARHDALRSSIGFQQEEWVQIIHPMPTHFEVPFYKLDATHLPHTTPIELQTTLKALNQQNLIDQPFSLEQAPLWRAALIKFDETTYQFLILAHHIIIDETSIGIIFNDLSAYYTAFLTNTPPNLPTIPEELRTLSLNVSEELTKQRLTYWTENFENFNVLRLPTDLQEQGRFGFVGERHGFDLELPLLDQLKKSFPTQSINNLMLGVLLTLFYTYTGETDICLGITSANRRHEVPGIDKDIIPKHYVNCLFNSIPVRTRFSSDISFMDLLPKIREQVGNALKNQLPLDEIHQHALSEEAKRGLSTASPFSVMLTTNTVKPTLILGNAKGTYPVELHIGGHTKFPYFGINLDEQTNGAYTCFIEYNTHLFTKNTIVQLVSHLKHILGTVAAKPTTALSDMAILQPEELKLIDAYNQTQPSKDYTYLAFPDQFHELATEQPDQLALAFHAKDKTVTRLTYRALDQASTQLANHLLTRGLNPGDKIGVSLIRSPRLIVTMLAVFKAGLTFIPFETRDTQANLIATKIKLVSHVITDDETSPLFSMHFVQLIRLTNPETQAAIANTSTDYHSLQLPKNHDAYCMVTSGTTGTPKTILVSHEGLANLVIGVSALDLPRGAPVLCTSLPTNDPIIFDLAVMVAHAGVFNFTDESVRYSPGFLNHVIEQEKIKIGAFLPHILDQLNPTTDLKVISEGAQPHDLSQWGDAYNGYGPTEATVCTTLFHYSTMKNLVPPSIIGQPIANLQIFIVNQAGALCAPGIPGELIITGAGVAKGYLNDTKRTEQAFPTLRFDPRTQKLIPCDPNTQGAMRAFRTSDLGCYFPLPDGSLSIKLLGRTTSELKIRGVMINLRTIEEQLRRHDSIADILVMPTPSNDAIQAYIIPKYKDNPPDNIEMRRQIHRYLLDHTTLPRVAYPQHVLVIRSFPYLESGKVDTALLPTIDTTQSTTPIQDTNQLSPLEKIVLGIWSNILKINPNLVDMQETFHSYGGDSIQLCYLEKLINQHPRLNLTSPVTAPELPPSITIESLVELLSSRCTMSRSSTANFGVFNSRNQAPPGNIGLEEQKNTNRF